MKPVILAFVLAIISIAASAQSIEYGYDACGNRVASLRSAASHDDHKNQWYEREASAYARRHFEDDIWMKYASTWHQFQRI